VPADPVATWDRLVGVIGDRSMMLSSVYVHARMLGWTDKGLELGFARDSLHASLGSDADNLGKLRGIIAGELGGEVPVTVKLLTDLPAPSPGLAQAASVAERDREKARVDKAAKEAEARQHPLTKVAVDTFDAVIKEIKEL
jgi:hypothetical protein